VELYATKMHAEKRAGRLQALALIVFILLPALSPLASRAPPPHRLVDAAPARLPPVHAILVGPWLCSRQDPEAKFEVDVTVTDCATVTRGTANDPTHLDRLSPQDVIKAPR
jgi:hypothetical protein